MEEHSEIARVSRRAAQMLTSHAAFLAGASPSAAEQLLTAF